MSEKKYIKAELDALKGRLKRSLDNKFFRLWMNRYGLPQLDREQRRYIMKQYWNTGTVGCGKWKHLEGAESLFFAPYNTDQFDIYYEPGEVTFINERGSNLIPMDKKQVNVDACIGWCNSGRNAMKKLVEPYIDRMLEIELSLNTNIMMQQMPFVLAVTPESKMKAQDFITKLFNHEPVIVTDVETINAIQAFLTEAPYVADKLRQLYYDYESQCLTILGIDNSHNDSTQDRMLLDAVNANNVQINLYCNDIDTCVQEFLDDIKETFGVEITLDSKVEEAQSEYDADTDGLADNTNRQPNNGGGSNDSK